MEEAGFVFRGCDDARNAPLVFMGSVCMIASIVVLFIALLGICGLMKFSFWTMIEVSLLIHLTVVLLLIGAVSINFFENAMGLDEKEIENEVQKILALRSKYDDKSPS
mmetsp:Transcript_21436/g.52517  ORF Transcript_21436/g.52517 Transcript_21436/m.52517 type:complete len:108 (+) Transcript_21436:482-805(+)